mmetsp:Transcript_28972/g.81593  ORF Transcript_28972/g.81593 Transcript_28972/m.81593 type:complete len:248 (+) Transcript_28972:140-883(+)
MVVVNAALRRRSCKNLHTCLQDLVSLSGWQQVVLALHSREVVRPCRTHRPRRGDHVGGVRMRMLALEQPLLSQCCHHLEPLVFEEMYIGETVAVSVGDGVDGCLSTHGSRRLQHPLGVPLGLHRHLGAQRLEPLLSFSIFLHLLLQSQLFLFQLHVIKDGPVVNPLLVDCRLLSSPFRRLCLLLLLPPSCFRLPLSVLLPVLCNEHLLVIHFLTSLLFQPCRFLSCCLVGFGPLCSHYFRLRLSLLV